MKTIRLTIVIIAAVAFAGVLGFKIWQHINTEPYKTFLSIDRKFKIVVYRMPALMAAPGDSGGASGYVCLFDASGNLLYRKDIEMVQYIEESDIEWKKHSVYIKLFAEWSLPSK